MAILNEPQLNAEIVVYDGLITALNDGGQNSALKVRTALSKSSALMTDLLQSLQAYGGVISDGSLGGIAITATPTKWLHFSNNDTSPNALLEADVANDRIKILEPALYFLTLRFFGKWPSVEDLRFDIYVNGIPNVLTPISFAKGGNGAADPETVSVTDMAFIINEAMITAGGGFASVELFMSSDTGGFDLDQDDIIMGMEYNPLSIGTVG